MSQYYNPITHVVTIEEDGWILKKLLQKKLNISRKLLSRLKYTEKGIMVNGERVYISVPVRNGDVVEIRMEQESSEDILPQAIPFEIVFEDDHLLVVNKEAGRIVHPTHGHYVDTLANGVVHYWLEQGKAYRFRPVHRLDRETTGVLVIAKNPYVHQHISEQMIAGTVDKNYLALVHNIPSLSEGLIDGPIDRDPTEPHRRIVTPTGYSSLTRYWLLEKYQQASLVRLKLESGRTHQIRVHMTSIGCPLIGDSFYRHPIYNMLDIELEDHCDDEVVILDRSIGRQALHAYELTFIHPILHESMTFTAPLPLDMEILRNQLRGDSIKEE
ncbi:RluA family pseudouridine synthase [Paenibacillus crassostreae]|uniref:Pseudouridine synthase n=1 Tax=Paenibacillus crassostreae TaxID=1763538 RepID=A0A167GTF1_9BACL|nr:RluA family pseudouridine synthase [Paenibacillus crassostreae]AOZ92078.1 RNA pseudouridine synthase [Paenibacillus crassostreae]OAB77887.1 RNA pseudouridine synthase [Paenibacillus crassostreae]